MRLLFGGMLSNNSERKYEFLRQWKHSAAVLVLCPQILVSSASSRPPFEAPSNQKVSQEVSLDKLLHLCRVYDLGALFLRLAQVYIIDLHEPWSRLVM